MQKWLDDLSSKFESDCTTSLQKSLKKIKTIEDITSKINIKLDILNQMVYFNILGRYLAIVELKSNPLKEFAEDDDIFNMPFEEAIESLKSRRSSLFEDVNKINKSEKQNLFWIKKTTDLTVTRKIQESLLRNLKKGGTNKEFLDNIEEFKLPKDYLKGVYRTVITQAQQRGHAKKQMEMSDYFEYGLYSAIEDGRTTHQCKELHGKVMKITDFIEKGLYPPLHYNCRSSIIQLSKEDVKDLGLEITEDYDTNDDRFSDYRYLTDKSSGKKKSIYKEYYESQKLKVVNLFNKIKEFIKKITGIFDIVNNKTVFEVANDSKLKILQQDSDYIYKNSKDYITYALNMYTGILYTKINALLKEHKNGYINKLPDDIEEYVNGIDNAMNDFKLKENLIVFKGTHKSYYKDWNVGEIRSTNIFLSTSLDLDIATHFKFDLMLEIRVKQGTKCIYIGDNSESLNEKELLLSRNLKYKVIEKTNEKMLLEVYDEDPTR
ncbi:phage minor head protein [Pseudostreptobacillus hongkongensis]|uniref:phage minor head protein n=1 Tax=Pseudostreptobacillus hongkongensis TaxID=1162717 RepID=UPI00082CB57F|nr:phage minor head protein [Pseudostreptobacillus hongkongensis]